MLTIDGTEYHTPMEAAHMLGVKPSTLRGYIARGVLPEAPRVRIGRRLQRGFTKAYLDAAKRTLESS